MEESSSTVPILRLERELLFQMVAIAAIDIRLRQPSQLGSATIRALRLTIRPAHENHELAAVLLVSKVRIAWARVLIGSMTRTEYRKINSQLSILLPIIYMDSNNTLPWNSGITLRKQRRNLLRRH